MVNIYLRPRIIWLAAKMTVGLPRMPTRATVLVKQCTTLFLAPNEHANRSLGHPHYSKEETN